ncbi:MAG: pectate lyase [Verrucomicrobiales bacterium]|nr:pectate lyase [Verrucomicrobiales bacterium]
MHRVSCLLAPLLLLPTLPALAEEPVDRGKVLASMKRAVAFYRTNLSVDGGYATTWTLDPVIGKTEHMEGPTVFSIQPHGTTTVGRAMLKAWEATGEKAFLDGAVESGHALARCQLSSGGWPSSFDFDPDFAKRYHLRSQLDSGDKDPKERRIRSTLDDNKTQSALLLLLELATTPDLQYDKEIQRAWQFGIDSLIAAQRPDGGWPQQFDGPCDPEKPVLKASFPEGWPRKHPKENYVHFVTLNDGNLYHVMNLLLLTHELTKNPAALESATKLGDFLLRAQMPDPQPAWAQQYNDSMHPVWARKFEPPSISSAESLGAAQALLELWIATGENKYRAAIEPALAWLESSQLKNGKWARFYELQTNRPLYCEADTYRVTYDDSNLPTHYAFQIGGWSGKIESLKKQLTKAPEDIRKSRERKSDPDSLAKLAKSLQGRVRNAINKQHEDGYWLRDDRVDAREFVKQMTVMSDYLRAVR